MNIFDGRIRISLCNSNPVSHAEEKEIINILDTGKALSEPWEIYEITPQVPPRNQSLWYMYFQVYFHKRYKLAFIIFLKQR